MATQTQLRRGTEAQCDAMTPAEGELIIDMTNDRGRIGDGLEAGGIHWPNYKDIINQRYGYAVDAGTLNALAITLYKPFTGNADGRQVKVKVLNTNTGPATLQVDSETPLAIKKMSGGALVDVDAGDLVAGGIYEFNCDGTYWQSQGGGGISAVKQGDLDTSQGVVSNNFGTVNPSAISGNLTLPGGEYGFWPQLRATGSANGTGVSRILIEANSASSTFVNRIRFQVDIGGTGTSVVLYAQQRYINASPPYNIGDGECGGFLFMLLDKNGEIVSHYIADAPPWAYNGPTRLRPDYVCRATGRKFRRVIKNRSIHQIMEGAPIKYFDEEITKEVQNRDMPLIPHPFPNHHPDLTVVLVNPYDQRLRDLIELLNNGMVEEVQEIISGGYLEIQNAETKFKSPPGVKVVRFKYKRGGK